MIQIETNNGTATYNDATYIWVKVNGFSIRVGAKTDGKISVEAYDGVLLVTPLNTINLDPLTDLKSRNRQPK